MQPVSVQDMRPRAGLFYEAGNTENLRLTWQAAIDGDADFFELNDLLQELGTFAFRHPVPAYRHDAAMFLFRRGWIAHDSVAAGSPTRPDSDRTVIADLVERIEGWLS